MADAARRADSAQPGLPRISLHVDVGRPGWAVLHLAGRFDATTAGALEDAFEELLFLGGRDLVVVTNDLVELGPECQLAVADAARAVAVDGGLLVLSGGRAAVVGALVLDPAICPIGTRP